jgi:hypothetical protein
MSAITLPSMGLYVAAKTKSTAEEIYQLYTYSERVLGNLLLGCSVISVSFIIYMLNLLLIPLVGLHFCVGLDFVTPSL